jgi:glycosyltransferase involved in cell wall biosynthesis
MNSLNSLITVYITNYNYAKFIETAINSVLSQQHVNFELFIIDDGSTDDSKSIIEKYRNDERVSIIFQQNKGLNVTNNIALRLSNGKYIMRLDADDYLEPDALKKLSDQLDAKPDLGLVFPDYYIVDEDGKLIEHHKRHDFKKEVTLFDQAAHGACTMIRVSFLKSLGGYNENYKCQDGYELWVKFISKYKVANVNIPLFNYRQHGTYLTNNENRILGTRAKINADFIETLEIDNKAIAIIPVRNKKDKFYNLKFDNESLLNLKIREALKSNSIEQVIITSPDREVEDYISIENKANPKVNFYKRSTESSQANISLDKAILEITQSETISKKVNTIIILDLRFPLISFVKINDAVNTLLLFGADSLVSVRPESSVFFRHDGTGMKTLFKEEKISKLERNVIYKHVGGITITNLQSFISSNSVINGQVGHIVLDKNSSYRIDTAEDISIVSKINELYKLI